MHFNFYECESDIQPNYFMTDFKPHKPPYWNYSVPEFRDWWVKCAVDSVRGSNGALDGLFFDAIPKVETTDETHLSLWIAMVDKIRTALGKDAILINNGFYLSPRKKLAGEEAWKHTGLSYTESLSGVGYAGVYAHPATGVEYLQWLANASAANPGHSLIGHGDVSGQTMTTTTAQSDLDEDQLFRFGLAKYMLVTSTMKNGWFLANNGSYSIDGGLLNQPMSVYKGDDGVECGEPIAMFERIGGAGSYKLRRKFERGSITVDVEVATASIDCHK